MAIDASNFSHAELDILQGMGEPIGERERRHATPVAWEKFDDRAWLRLASSKPTAEDARQRNLAADLMRDVQRRRRKVA